MKDGEIFFGFAAIIVSVVLALLKVALALSLSWWWVALPIIIAFGIIILPLGDLDCG